MSVSAKSEKNQYNAFTQRILTPNYDNSTKRTEIYDDFFTSSEIS